jgi:ABC-type Fe3+/spermidine/putrescine transport system ATPase subunit
MLSIENLNFAYELGSDLILADLNLQIETGEIVCLLGESGSGKTTLLRIIAGLEPVGQSKVHHEGQFINTFNTIRLDGQLISKLPVHKRGFGFMFQDFALFPHLNVGDNVAFGLKMLGTAKQEQRKIVAETLKLVGLANHEKRQISSLSGGQKQRVALARSLAPKPRLLMLDEPLGALDAGLRKTLVQDLRRIIKQIGLTTIYVTHDQQEAFAIADRIAIMYGGRIEQFDKPEVIYHQPKNAYVARFLGLANILPAAVLQQFIALPSEAKFFLIHPDSLRVDEAGQIVATVRETMFRGDTHSLTLEIGEKNYITMSIPSTERIPKHDESIRLTINPSKLVPMSNR